MRILYHSGAPNINTGYGRATREIAPRLHNGDHEVAIQSLGSVLNQPIWWHGEEFDGELQNSMKIYNGSQQDFGMSKVMDNYEDFNADFYFTHFDTWMGQTRDIIPDLGIPYASYAIVDHYPAPKAVADQVLNAHRTVTMSKYAKNALEEKGVRSIQIPHGVNTDNFYPIEDSPDTIETVTPLGEKKLYDIDDTFIVGMIAANFGDRKHIPEQMQAFKMFLDRVDDSAILYIHTKQNSEHGFDLSQVQKEIGIPDKNLFVARTDDYHNVGDTYLNSWYNTFDVLLNCSRGESWGFTITESQAAGTPCICTNFSSMPEQLGINPGDKPEFTIHQSDRGGVHKAPHGVVVEPTMGMFRERVSAKHYITHPLDILYALEYYYVEEEQREMDGWTARNYVEDNYTWENNVIPKFEEMFNELEEEI